jgi:cyclopropane fatty-acyl-phospholipid synthase-like methyltransferase
MDIFDREKMIQQLNLEVAARLHFGSEDNAFLIDLGCGFGAISRTVAKNYSNVTIKGVTLSPAQVETAKKLNARQNLQDRIEIFEADYTKLPFEDGAADGVFAIESACYAAGAAKEDLIREMARVLKPGGRFVIADCFLKTPAEKFNAFARKCYDGMCKNWALPEIASLRGFTGALEKHGFRDVAVEDIYWRAAPSIAYAPYAVFSFIAKKFFAGEPLKPQSVNNLKASLLAPLVSLNRSKFGYYLISGTRG